MALSDYLRKDRKTEDRVAGWGYRVGSSLREPSGRQRWREGLAQGF